MSEILRQYTIDFDRGERDEAFLHTQIETHLKERFNVLVSKVEYGIADGHLVRLGTLEPFIDSIKRGRDFVQRLSQPNTIDFDRENAEVAGFETVIDPFLSNPNTPLESKVLNISLRGEEGSKYQHNFYDIFSLKEKDGKRIVELSRFSSGLSAKDYAVRLRLPTDPPPTDAQFLASPTVMLGVDPSSEEIHALLHVEHEYMTPLEFAQIWENRLVQDRVSTYLLRKNASSFNAILNCADDVWKYLSRTESKVYLHDYMPTDEDIREWEEREVRQTAGGCPGVSGAGPDSSSPYSVAEYGIFAGGDAKNDPNLCRCGGKEPHFHCPGKAGTCSHAIVVGKGISSCPACGEGKKC